MDEVSEFCARVLADPGLAAQAVAEARGAGAGDRLADLAAAGRACRARAQLVAGPPAPSPDPSEATGLEATGLEATGLEATGLAAPAESLEEAVSRELSSACAQLPERHRETLALRELLGLSYAEIAAVIGVEEVAVGPLLSRARLRLRSALRGPVPPIGSGCAARDRALRALARRLDGEPGAAQEEDWLLDHLGSCPVCERDHAAMLEASACYRAWPPAPGRGLAA